MRRSRIFSILTISSLVLIGFYTVHSYNNRDTGYSCKENLIDNPMQAKDFFLSRLHKYSEEDRQMLSDYGPANRQNNMIGWQFNQRHHKNNKKYLWTVSISFVGKSNIPNGELMQFTSCGRVLEDFEPDVGVKAY